MCYPTSFSIGIYNLKIKLLIILSSCDIMCYKINEGVLKMKTIIRDGNKIIAFDNESIYYYSDSEKYLKNSRFTIYGNFEDEALLLLKRTASKILSENRFEEMFFELLNQKRDNNSPLLKDIKIISATFDKDFLNFPAISEKIRNSAAGRNADWKSIEIHADNINGEGFSFQPKFKHKKMIWNEVIVENGKAQAASKRKSQNFEIAKTVYKNIFNAFI